MDRSEAMETAEEPWRRPQLTWRGGVRRMTLSEGQRLRVTGLSLADPAAAVGRVVQPRVTVWAEVGHEALMIGTLSSEQPIAPAAPPLELAGSGGVFFLRHDSALSSVRLYGYYLDPPEPNPDGEGESTKRRFLVDIYAEELGDADAYEYEDEEAEVEYEYEYETLTGNEDDDREEEDQPLVSTST